MRYLKVNCLAESEQLPNKYHLRTGLAHPNSPAACLNLLFWHGLRSKCADLLSSYLTFYYVVFTIF